MNSRHMLSVFAAGLFCLTVAGVATAGAQGLSPVEIGAPAGSDAYVRDANDQNTAVGFAAYSDTDRAFLWRRRGFEFLPQPENAFATRAYGINKHGKIVGFADLYDPKSGSFGSAAVLWDGRSVKLLTTPKGATDTGAVRINERGQVIGWAFYEPEFGGPTHYQALLWENGVVRQINPPAGMVDARPAQINRGGVVAATAIGASDANTRGFLWSDGVATLLPLPDGAVSSEVNDVNDSGVAVGNVTFIDPLGNRRTVPAVWQNGAVTVLSDMGGMFSQAISVGGFGQIVGTTSTTQGTARLVMWDEGRLIDLGAADFDPVRINSRGAVFGTHFNDNGTATAFLVNTR